MEQKSKRKRHSREFKLEAVRRSCEVGKTVAEVACELDVRENDLHQWRKEVYYYLPIYSKDDLMRK